METYFCAFFCQISVAFRKDIRPNKEVCLDNLVVFICQNRKGAAALAGSMNQGASSWDIPVYMEVS